MEAKILLEEWLNFSKELESEWWAIKKEQSSDTYTQEGIELQRLQNKTKKFLELKKS